LVPRICRGGTPWPPLRRNQRRQWQ